MGTKPNVKRMEVKKDVEGLVKALEDKDEGVRSVAAGSLGEIGDARGIEPLIHALKDKVEWVRREAAEALGKIGGARAVEALTQSLKDKNSSLRWTAALSLGKIGDARAVEPLTQALEDKDPSVRWRVALTLGEIGDARAVEPLTQALEDKDGDVRERAAEALGMLGDIQYLERLLGDKSEAVRSDAAEKLVNVAGLKAVPALIRALKDNRKEIYDTAAWAIQVPLMEDGAEHIGEERLREALIPAIEYLINMVEKVKILKGARSYDEYVARAIGTLGAIGEPSAIPALKNLLAKVKEKIAAEGEVREYVETGIAAGYISSLDDMHQVESAIKEIRRKSATNSA